jgi:hypothetical protein
MLVFLHKSTHTSAMEQKPLKKRASLKSQMIREKTKILLGLICVCSVLIFSSCAKKIFTQSYRNTIVKSGNSCKDVQFYNSIPIELKREVSSSEAKTSKGVVKIENGKYYEYILFRKETQGVCEKDQTIFLSISFEEGGYLLFWSSKDETYYRLAEETNNSKFLKDGDRINYMGKWYDVTKGSDAKLLFRDNIKNKEKTERRTAKGRKVE